MSHAPLRLAFSVARPLRRPQDPTLFLRACRSISNSSPLRAVPHSTTVPAKANTSRPALSTPRHFSSTTTRRAVVVAQNPRTDDDGHDMTIEITERAAKRLKQITSAPPQKNTLTPSAASDSSHLRVTVTAGGCHGFQYLMSLEDASKIDQEEDTVFVSEEADGPGKAEVVMDQASLELLKGSTVDFTTELIGSQFKIVGNPRATSSCGCGTSFDIE
ncbi:hypothetical protein EDD37DRAFT_647405 [Exophiala viscosa]|uniref:Core domain-containing protein n=1 Tax=Exophiala viscosa TaxID=2486360 RepID=A0AAN6E695_9EURO|nr:hypothetical protein EDD36DRAFT_480508 [Exophiala viscosa]KAI1627745.1 hypothetical protein EDD37DRAFT_647405 [Exophiala viscosa]